MSKTHARQGKEKEKEIERKTEKPEVKHPQFVRSMGRCIIASSSTLNLTRISRLPTSILSSGLTRFLFSNGLSSNPQSLKHEFDRTLLPALSCRRGLCTKAVLSNVSEEKQYFKVAADSTGPVPSDRLLEVIEIAAKTGAQVS